MKGCSVAAGAQTDHFYQGGGVSPSRTFCFRHRRPCQVKRIQRLATEVLLKASRAKKGKKGKRKQHSHMLTHIYVKRRKKTSWKSMRNVLFNPKKFQKMRYSKDIIITRYKNSRWTHTLLSTKSLVINYPMANTSQASVPKVWKDITVQSWSLLSSISITVAG